jgi:hypothetical protein
VFSRVGAILTGLVDMVRKVAALVVLAVLAVGAVVTYGVFVRPRASAVAANPAAPAPAPTPAPASATPLPSVHVTNIGMHIGGGPNDAPTKDPIARSVAPHFDELRACWSSIDDPTRAGDFGVDLLIPARGGKATVTNPRTRLGPQAFRDCVVGVFENVEFLSPRTGKTMVSYSLQFAP